NPSLTITAMTERAMSKIPPKPGAETLHLPDEARPARTADNTAPAREPGPSETAESWTPLEP
ncbi:MAG: hypothetical protein J0H98_08670, partial [Solirubrobacterales bacterium]|nr:hypothetical protein [Solirubrobacterales bacterium]